MATKDIGQLQDIYRGEVTKEIIISQSPKRFTSTRKHIHQRCGVKSRAPKNKNLLSWFWKINTGYFHWMKMFKSKFRRNSILKALKIQMKLRHR